MGDAIVGNHDWKIVNNDCITGMAELPDDVFDFSVFSPPFPSLYAYTNKACDIGNSEGLQREGKLHLSFFYKQLSRVIKPGRAICVHVMQIPRLKRSGELGLHDFRGLNIKIGERAGLIYEYDWAIRKNPQSQAIRTRSRELQFNGLESDRARQRGTVNYDALNDGVDRGNLGALILDESSMLKSHYGKWGTTILRIGSGLEWKLCCSGTPAPNDRIEYANHAVFLDQFQNVNAFLATYFVNKGQTQERWVLKPHALNPFYRAISHWAFFLTNPATYGWKDNSKSLPPINVHIHDVPLTDQQKQVIGIESGELFATKMGGITSRSVMGQIAKGNYRGTLIDTNKPRFIRELIESWPEESTIVWCIYNAEQERLANELPNAVSITGSTSIDERQRLIDGFKAGEYKTLISKPKILGFGLNLQVATRQVFSGLQDSYESYYQAVKRSNRIGSTKPLNVHIPMTDVEIPMVENVLRKAQMVQRDTEMQESLFRGAASKGSV